MLAPSEIAFRSRGALKFDKETTSPAPVQTIRAPTPGWSLVIGIATIGTPLLKDSKTVLLFVSGDASLSLLSRSDKNFVDIHARGLCNGVDDGSSNVFTFQRCH